MTYTEKCGYVFKCVSIVCKATEKNCLAFVDF